MKNRCLWVNFWKNVGEWCENRWKNVGKYPESIWKNVGEWCKNRWKNVGDVGWNSVVFGVLFC